jgi:hypothetical protein
LRQRTSTRGCPALTKLCEAVAPGTSRPLQRLQMERLTSGELH